VNQSDADPLVVVEDQDRPLVWIEPVAPNVRVVVVAASAVVFAFAIGLMVGFGFGVVLAGLRP
jgi:hypothetical protein